MKLAVSARTLGKKITLITAAFVLAVSTLTAAVPFILSQRANAIASPEVVYNALPSVTPSTNYPSYGAQAHQFNEFGDRVELGGANRVLNTVTATLSAWAKQSDAKNVTYCANNPSKCTSDGFYHPITLNVYKTDGSLLASKAQTVLVPWRSESDPSCGPTSNGTGWKEGSVCYDFSGLAFNVTFDFSASQTVLPGEVLVGVAYKTNRTLGVAGPYDSLNVTFPDYQTVSVGADNNTTGAYVATSNPAYWDTASTTFSEFETWPGSGTVALQITASPVDTSSTTFVNDPKYVRANNGGDLAAQLVTPDATEDVRFFVDGNTANPFSGSNVGGAGATTSWWRLYTPLAAGAHEVSAEVKVGGVWYSVADTTTTYSLDTPTASYVSPSTDNNAFRPSDNPVRVKAEDQFEQFSKMRVTINGVVYEVLRSSCDLRAAGNYVLCDVNTAPGWTGLTGGVYTATTSVYTQANNRLDNLVSPSFVVDGTVPTITSFATPADPTDATFSVSASAVDAESGVESINFFITEPRASDGACTGNGTKLFESRVTTPVSGIYTANFNATLNGTYCLNAVARNNAMGNSVISHQAVTIDSKAPVVEINNVNVSASKKLSFDLTATDAGSGLQIVSANIYNAANTGDPIIELGSGNPTRLNTPHSGLAAGTTSFAWSATDIDVSGLASGTYTIRAFARDHVNLEHRFLLVRFTVDNTPITVTADTFARVGNAITPNVVTDETPASQAWTQVSGPTGGVTISDASALTPTFTVLQDGTYSFKLAVLDAAGNPSFGLFNFTYTTPEIVNNVVGGNTGGDDGDDADGAAAADGFVGPTFIPQSSDPSQLGAQDEANGTPGVEGASIEKNLASALGADNTDGNALGLAWYWWLLIIAGGSTAVWWIVAAVRGRAGAE